MSAGALELCKVASGSGEAFLSHTEALWDIAAGELIVREAGGQVDIEKSRISGRQRIIASNEEIHGFLEDLSSEFYD